MGGRLELDRSLSPFELSETGVYRVVEDEAVLEDKAASVGWGRGVAIMDETVTSTRARKAELITISC